jgi:hypothetical protein
VLQPDLLISLTIFVWGSGLGVLGLSVLGRGRVSRGLGSERHWLAVAHWLLVHLHLHLLLVHHVRRHGTESVVETHWHWTHVFVWVESSESTRKGSQISNRSDLNDRILVLIMVELWRTVVVILVIIVLSSIVVLHLLWHWRKSHTLREVWERVDELSLLLIIVVEGAAVSEFAFSTRVEVLARHGFVIRVNSTKGGLTEILRKRVIWLSELSRSMSELTVLLKRTFIIFKIMLAHLGLVLLLKSVELTLVSVEIVVVGLLGKMLQNLTRRVVKVSWSSLGVKSFSLISGLWLTLGVLRSRCARSLWAFGFFSFGWGFFLWGDWQLLIGGWDF